jgi:MerR family redox-sensitive transcriptional activator SoxR
VRTLSIGEVARSIGLAPSALRYYEKAGLLPNPLRAGGRRRYAPEILGRLRIILLARDAGFTIAETRTFLTGFSNTTPPAQRWNTLAQRKVKELDALMTRITKMRALLARNFHCECLRIEDCERLMA